MAKRIVLAFVLFNFIAANALCATQNNETKSEQAREILTEIIRELPRLENGGQNERINSDLFRLLLSLRQYDEAEQIALKADPTPKSKFYAQLCHARIKELSTPELFANSLAEVKRMAKDSSGFDLLRNPATFQDLLSNDQFETVSEIIDSLSLDLSRYKYKSGSYSDQYCAMSTLAIVAGAQMRAGNSQAAKSFFNSFGDIGTRDKARQTAILNNLSKTNYHPQAAEAIFELIESDAIKFWIANRIGTAYLARKDLNKAIAFARKMDDLEESTTNYRSHQAQLWTGIAFLQLELGQSFKAAIDRAGEILPDGKAQKIDRVCIYALQSDFDEASIDEQSTYAAFSKLLDLEQDRDPFGRNSSGIPKSFSAKQQIDAAFGLAEKVAHPYQHAMILCKISNLLSSKSKVPEPNKPNPFGGGVTERSTSVVDPEKAKEIVRVAIELAKESADPFEVNKNFVFDQSFILKIVAVEAVKVSLLSEAVELIKMIPESKPSDPRMAQRLPKLNSRELAMEQACYHLGHTDPPFIEDDGKDVFSFVETALDFEKTVAYKVSANAAAKFIEVDRWDHAETIQRQLKEKHPSMPMVPGIGVGIAHTEDVERLRYWNAKCETDRRPEFFFSIVRFFKNKKTFPKREFLIELDSLTRQHVKDGGRPLPDTDELLILGYWYDGLKEEGKEKLANFPKGNSRNLISLGIRAVDIGMNDLAILVIDEMNNDESKQHLMQTIRQSKTDDESMKDADWLKQQPLEVQLSWKMNKAKRIIDKNKELIAN